MSADRPAEATPGGPTPRGPDPRGAAPRGAAPRGAAPRGAAPRGAAPDWPAIHAEALDILCRYLRIDTSNPPGNEAQAARFLGALLEAEGIATEYIETQPGREVLVGRLPADVPPQRAEPALMLCNHTDVVPVEAEQWEVPPFGGVVRDGRIYGRGAVDMKGAAVMQLLAMLTLRRLRIPLRREVVFCAVPDEELGSVWGMAWLCDHRPDVVDVGFEINEGGTGVTDIAGQPGTIFGIGTAEKESAWLTLRTAGRPGHASLPHPDNAVERLARAVARLSTWERPLIYTADSRRMVETLIRDGVLPDDPGALERALRADPEMEALLTQTVNATMLEAGYKQNVVPGTATAAIDTRILPGTDREAWLAEVRARIDDPAVEVTWSLPAEPPQVAAPWETELVGVMTDVVRAAHEGATVMPQLLWGATDNRFLRRRGVSAYGFIPCLLTAEERRGFHAHNEFLLVRNLQSGCELMYETVRRFCAVDGATGGTGPYAA